MRFGGRPRESSILLTIAVGALCVLRLNAVTSVHRVKHAINSGSGSSPLPRPLLRGTNPLRFAGGEGVGHSLDQGVRGDTVKLVTPTSGCPGPNLTDEWHR